MSEWKTTDRQKSFYIPFFPRPLGSTVRGLYITSQHSSFPKKQPASGETKNILREHPVLLSYLHVLQMQLQPQASEAYPSGNGTKLIHKFYDLSRWRCPVYRRTNDQSICFLHFFSSGLYIFKRRILLPERFSLSIPFSFNASAIRPSAVYVHPSFLGLPFNIKTFIYNSFFLFPSSKYYSAEGTFM